MHNSRGVGFFYNPGSTSVEVCIARIDEFLETGEFLYRDKTSIPTGVTAEVQFGMISPLALDNGLFNPSEIVVVGTRGAVLDGAKPGVTIIDDRVIAEITAGRVGTIHPCNNAPLFGHELARILTAEHQPKDGPERTVKAYFADPVSSIDPEYLAEATITGHPDLRVKGYGHYLNMREIIRRHAAHKGIPVEQVNAIIVHAGGGITVATVRNGKIIVVNNANEAGPYSDGRPGSLPTLDFAGWLWSQFTTGKQLADVQAYLLKKCGLFGIAGVADFKEAEKKFAAGDPQVTQALNAFFFHIAEEIAKRMVAADFSQSHTPDLILTGGIAHSELLQTGITKWLGDEVRESTFVYPGSFEMESLARQVFQAHLGQVPVNTFTPLI